MERLRHVKSANYQFGRFNTINSVDCLSRLPTCLAGADDITVDMRAQPYSAVQFHELIRTNNTCNALLTIVARLMSHRCIDYLVAQKGTSAANSSTEPADKRWSGSLTVGLPTSMIYVRSGDPVEAYRERYAKAFVACISGTAESKLLNS